MTDYAFSPTVIEAPRGSRARITLSNESLTTTHTFTIPGVVNVEVAPGQERLISVITPVEAGYAFACRFHAESGMRGALNDPQPPDAVADDEPAPLPPASPASDPGYDRPGY